MTQFSSQALTSGKGDLICYPQHAVMTSPKNNIFDTLGESADLLQEAGDLLSDLLLQLRIPGEQRVAQQHLKEKIECKSCRVKRDKVDMLDGGYLQLGINKVLLLLGLMT